MIAPSGGPEAYLKVLSPWLSKEGHKVTVLCICLASQKRPSFPENVDARFIATGNLHYYLSKLTGEFRNWPIRLRTVEQELAVEKMAHAIDRARKIDLIEVTEGTPVSRLRRQWPILIRAHGADWLFRRHC